MTEIVNMTTLITIVGVLVALVNIVTEVLKKVLPSNWPTSLLATIISLVITLLAFFAYCSYASVAVTWYYVVAAVIVGFMVSYAAMFGFDKLKEILAKLGQSKNK